MVFFAGLNSVKAGAINWGSQFGSVNVQSDGTTAVSGGFTIQLGKFASGFTPDGTNISLWAANWVVFDSLDPGEHNAASGYFTSEPNLLNNNVFASGDQAYVWMFNSQTAVPGSEWLLYTNDATDGIAADDWKFPTAPGSQQTLPLSWRVSNASRALFGGINPDGPGPDPRRTGDGIGTPPETPVHLQTYTFVPEPSGALLSGLAALFFMRRRRSHAPRIAAVVAVGILAAGTIPASAAPFGPYESTTPLLNIPDNDNTTGAARSISVAESFIINDLDVGLNITHTFRGDIRVTLTSPSNTTVQIVNPDVNDGFRNYDILLNDASSDPINDTNNDAVAAPFYDRQAGPSNPLSAFNGENAQGVWTLRFYDTALQDTGAVNRMALTFDGSTALLIVRVFDDTYWDGIYQAGVDPGVTGVTVTAYDNGGNSAVLTANGDGTYTLNAGSGLAGTAIRYEVSSASLPSGFFPGIVYSGPGANAAPMVGTAIVGGPLVTLNVPVQEPKTACLSANDLDLFTTCFIGGPRTNREEVLTFGGETPPFVPADAPAVVAFPRAAAGVAPSTQNRYLATIEQVGTTYGVAPQESQNRLYVGAFGKRHADTGPGGNGAIYALDSGGGGVLDTFIIPGAGNTAHGIDATNPANNGLIEGWIRDSNWYDRVGKEALGDVDINPAGTILWTVNLNDKHLYMVDVADPLSPSYGTVTDLGAVTATAECVGGEQNWRPFALCWSGSSLYLGGTCTGETTNNIDDVSVLIYRLNSPTVNTSKTLVYDSRLSGTDGGFKYDRGDTLIAWNPWRTTWDSTAFKSRSGFATIYPQPWLVDFTFDNNNRLVLGIRDRFGDQIGIYTKNPGLGGTGDSAADNNFYETVTMGEMLMAEWNPQSGATGVGSAALGDWRSEIAPGFSLTRQDDPNDGVTATEFLWRTSYTDVHPESAQGGVVFHPLIPNQVAAVAQDPFSLRSGGVQFFSTTDGTSPYQNAEAAGGYRIYQGQPQQGQLGLFGKANGLGDLEYGCATTTQQIGNVVWYDEDRDGVRDPAEVPITGMTVRLYADFDGDGLMDDRTGDSIPDAVMTTTTSAEGVWVFPVSDTTNYRVTFDRSTVSAFNDSLGSPVTVADLAPTRFQSTLNNGNPGNDSDVAGQFLALPTIALQSGDIGVSNHNFDAGFQSCPPLTVTSSPAPLATGVLGVPYSPATFSASGGTGPYTFTISSGALPPGMTLSAGGVLSGTPSGAGTVTFTVTAFDSLECTGSLAMSLTVEVAAHIGNLVWLDENSDGRQDAGEPGIPNVIVLLCDSTGATELASTVTDAWGGYGFDVAPGSYRVKVQGSSLPGGYTQTTSYPAPGSDRVNQDLAGGTGYPISVGSNGENLTADFGYNANPDTDVNTGANTASLGNRIWIDADCDGIQDPEEPGLAGVGIKLCVPGPDGLFHTPDDATINTAVSDANGYYLFDGLAPGAYGLLIHNQAALAGYTQTGDPDHWGTAAGVNDAELSVPVILAPGDVFLNADFGYCPPAALNNSVGDYVWFDANADGVQDSGEYGIPGVTVALVRDTNGNGAWDPNEPIVATNVTDAGGLYGFTGVPDGRYLVWVNDTNSVLGSLTQTFDSDGTASPNISAVDLDSASASATPVSNLSQDFGYTPPGHSIPLGLLGDYVWLDADNDGIQDLGESGIEGVTVTLCTAGADTVFGTSDDIAAATTQTDENGYYWFGGLQFGTYVIKVTPPAGLVQTFDDDGTLSANQSTIAIDSGTPVNLAQDFGYYAEQPGTVGNYVWIDSNADGVADPDGADNIAGTDDDEPAISGVTLDIYRDLNGNCQLDAGEGLIGTATTDANGAYLFTALPADDGGADARYIVDVSDRAGVLFGYWHSLGQAGTNGNSQNDPWCATISPGSLNDLTGDFGYYMEPASLGNYVWADNDWTGSQSPLDAPIPGVIVSLVINYPGGVTTTVLSMTDTNGHYSFRNLLVDEDHNCGVSSGPPVTQPQFTLSIAGGQLPLVGLVPTFIERAGVDTKLNSSDPAGVTAIPCEGLTDVLAQTPATLEQLIAGYDFGYRTLKPLTWDAFVNGSGLIERDALPLGNPDGDIYPNILEYAFCLPPRSGTPLTPNGDPSFCLLQGPGQTFNASITRPIGAAGLSYSLEYAGELGSPTLWIADEDITPVVQNNGNGTETVIWNDLEQIPALNAGHGYLRIFVRLDADGDEFPESSAATYVLGWLDHSIAQQCETYSNPFLKKEVFSGTGNAGSPENAIDVYGSASGTDVGALLSGGECLYVEIISGSLEGHRFAVNAAGSDADTIALHTVSPLNTVTPIPDLSGAAFVVREAWTFGDLFPASVFQGGGDLNTADNLLTFNSATQNWTTYFLADLGPGNGTYWVDAANPEPNPAPDGPPTSRDGRCIGPAEGLFVHRRGGAVTVPLFGVVRENHFAAPLRPGYTLVGGGHPVDQSYSDRLMSQINGFNGSADIRTADQAIFWAGDANPGHVCYLSYYLLDGGPSYQFWVSAEDSFVTNQDLSKHFKAGRAAFICSGSGLLDYRIPPAWQASPLP